jgi:Spy/CpxP family protein refolding chaperone
MKGSIRVGLAALALAGVSTLSMAQTPPASTPAPAPPGRMHNRGHEHPFMHILHQLDLTAEQKAKIHAIYEATRPNMESLGKSTHGTMEQLMTTPPGDASYAALVDTAKSNALAHIKLISDLQTQIYAVLTPEQQAKIPAIVTAEKAKRDAARKKWRATHEPAAAP